MFLPTYYYNYAFSILIGLKGRYPGKMFSHVGDSLPLWKQNNKTSWYFRSVEEWREPPCHWAAPYFTDGKKGSTS